MDSEMQDQVPRPHFGRDSIAFWREQWAPRAGFTAESIKRGTVTKSHSKKATSPLTLWRAIKEGDFTLIKSCRALHLPSLPPSPPLSLSLPLSPSLPIFSSSRALFLGSFLMFAWPHDFTSPMTTTSKWAISDRQISLLNMQGTTSSSQGRISMWHVCVRNLLQLLMWIISGWF